MLSKSLKVLVLCAALSTSLPLAGHCAEGNPAGVSAADAGELAAARATAAAEPTSAPAHVKLGYLLANSGALDEAMQHFDQALTINPRAFDAKTGRGVVLARMGKLKEAEEVLKGALILNPNPVRTHYELGVVYQQLGELEKAVAQFKEGIKKHEQGRI